MIPFMADILYNYIHIYMNKVQQLKCIACNLDICLDDGYRNYDRN